MDNGLIFPYRRRTAHTELLMLTTIEHDVVAFGLLLCEVLGTDFVR